VEKDHQKLSDAGAERQEEKGKGESKKAKGGRKDEKYALHLSLLPFGFF
jgi:hypothetical protein